MLAMRRWRCSLGLLAVSTTAVGVAFKLGMVPVHPELLAALAAATATTAVVSFIGDFVLLVRKRELVAGSRCLLEFGIFLALGAGLANWLLGYQIAVILNRGDRVLLGQPDRVQVHNTGPLARVHELDMEIELAKVELDRGPDGRVMAHSSVLVHRDREDPARLVVSRREPQRFGTARFFQGAFGFAPRIVVISGEKTVYDEIVPFTSSRGGASDIVFTGQANIKSEGLQVRANVDVGSLDEAMRGHATLAVAVSKEGVEVGRGRLRLGHFADIPGGYRIGFAGLERWSEIDVARSSYPRTIRAGLALILLGSIVWLVGVLSKK